MTDEVLSLIDLLVKIFVPIIAGVVGWVLKVLWDHHGEIGKINGDIKTLKTESYTQKDAKEDRTAMLAEFRELRHEIKADFQRLEGKIDDMREER